MWCWCNSVNHPQTVEVILGVKVVLYWLFEGKNGCLDFCMYPSQRLIDGRVLSSHLASFFVHCSSFHTDIDPLAQPCKVTSIWWGWSSSVFFFFKILSSKTEVVIWFQPWKKNTVCGLSVQTPTPIVVGNIYQHNRVAGSLPPFNSYCHYCREGKFNHRNPQCTHITDTFSVLCLE